MRAPRLRSPASARALAAALLAALPTFVAVGSTPGADLKISEMTFASGVVFPDVDVSGRGEGANDFVAGQVLRASVPLGARWSFFGEASRAGIPSSQLFGDAEMLSLRGGFRRDLAGGPWGSRFFADGALGWMRLALDHRALAVDRPVFAAALGQLFPVGHRTAFHWEVRVDATPEDRGDPVRGGLSQPSVLVGLTLRFPESRDDDRDGILDSRDACPGTPAGALVDASGCSLDDDYDGVPDGLDRCPGTPRGAPVGPNGCSVVSDRDDDGVPDGLDRCPDTPPAVLVDAEGCSREARFEVAGPVVLKGVRFDPASARLSADACSILDTVAESLRGRTDVRVEVCGHADPREDDERSLAQRRAESVRAYLIVKGVPPEILVAQGYGADAPVAGDASAAGRAANRRVELMRVQPR
ncbi:MAG TPA: OmpA family protein [bacterium]|nr:OmpA family protein [bacterium]